MIIAKHFSLFLQQEFLDKYRLNDATFSDFICLEQPTFARSKMPTKRQAGGKSNKSGRSDEDLEIIREAKRKAKELKDAKIKDVKEKGKSYLYIRSQAIKYCTQANNTAVLSLMSG